MAIFLMSAVSALAVPNLQLDIQGGTYDTSTETIVASGDVFTLYALLKDSSDLADTFMISAALMPKTAAGVDAGSFVFDGTTVNVTSGMVYGNPPIEQVASLQGFDAGDLEPHGIFDTYFKEFSFKFDPNVTVPSYDTQDGSSANGDLYRKAFVVDLSGLADGYNIHFDLYNTKIIDPTTKKPYTDVDVDDVAPFSHDAQGGGNPVPEPGTMMLLGAGFLGLAVYGKRRRNA